MKRISLFAMICCMARFVVSLIDFWPILSDDITVSIYNVLELLTWMAFSIFFGYFWKLRRRQARTANPNHNRQR